MPHKLTRVRQIAWVALLLTGAVQGWVFRHTVSPDGVAYLDLSDAVVHGRLSELVNGYWSPLYPTLLGLVRVSVSQTPLAEPYWEFTLLHVVSFLGFVLSLAAFEWLLRVLDDEGGDWGDSERPFASPRGLAIAYLLFAVMSLGMISVAGTVPDFFLSAAMLAAFASLLRLRADVANTVAAIQLGLALALGALTKSIAFPVGVVVLLGLALVSWTKGGRPAVLRSAAVFALATLPWTVALSIALGGPTTGRTGALNYAWYVNEQQPPNAGAVPALAISPDSLPLRRIAVMPDGRGTNPLWYDPAHWHGDVRPRFSAIQQWRRLAWSLRYYAYIVAPLLLAAVAIAVGTSWRQTALTLRRASVVLLPCAAALLAYALMYTTSRHVAVFLLAACVTLAAALPREAGISAARFSAAFGLTLLAIEALAPPMVRSMVTISYGLALFMVGWLALANRSPLARWVGAFATVLLVWLLALMPPLAARAAPLALGVAMWLAVSRASNAQRPTLFAAELRRAFAIAAVVAMAIPGLGFGVVALRRWIVAPEAEAHPEWTAAQRLIKDGVPSGSRIVLLGSPENTGWARLARFQIVAVVPEDQVEAFHRLSAADRDRLLRVFARAGATRVVSRPIP